MSVTRVFPVAVASVSDVGQVGRVRAQAGRHPELNGVWWFLLGVTALATGFGPWS